MFMFSIVIAGITVTPLILACMFHVVLRICLEMRKLEEMQ